MFSAAHQAGVLWNDVKLEHIYWDNPSGSVSVIDWGNAIFLDDQHPRTHPRWQDYQQMVEALGSFLQSAAPDLFEDLGWDEFHNKTLDASLVSTLARRISYQQQVIALQVMEYQSLIRVILNNEPALEGLRKIREYLQVLELTVAPWEREEILQYSRSLVENSLKEKAPKPRSVSQHRCGRSSTTRSAFPGICCANTAAISTSSPTQPFLTWSGTP